ncbi:TetR/AcrR family transcriptional regulator [Rhizobium sp. PL01]|uniref:TetR/AcrR family transcriptional regulator n=1 Tax=Rhizobium sp. PL01 TaxID=3085631 RepID=UPI002981473B|nr:TetR/AcrR family transcriptional regulator [Rhizobium sp. PL01]MDW5315878.1 TetR/AcrR family transcriptional regulator [Rhizobium sp. PL01]
MQNLKKLTRAEQKALRPIQILDAAFEEFVERGFTATRVEDIADRIGVTKGTIYVYFPTKEELFSAMIRHISVPFEAVLAEANDLSGSCTQRLKALVHLFYERVLKDRKTREMLRFVVSEGSRFPEVIDTHYRELIAPIFERTQALLDEGMRLGEFRRAPAARASIIVAPVLSMAVETLIFSNRRDLDLPGYIEAHLDIIVNGLAVAQS